MAFRYGSKFRRLAAQALSTDKGEMRALIERFLPRGEDGKRVLYLESEADCNAAAVAIVAAGFADEISGEGADRLLRSLEDPEVRRQAAPWWSGLRDLPAGFYRMSPEERLQAGFRPPENHSRAFRAWREVGRGKGDEVGLEATGYASGERQSHCGAASKRRRALVNNNENTSAAPGGDAARESRQSADPL
jgi:hypothetical protein